MVHCKIYSFISILPVVREKFNHLPLSKMALHILQDLQEILNVYRQFGHFYSAHSYKPKIYDQTKKREMQLG